VSASSAFDVEFAELRAASKAVGASHHGRVPSRPCFGAFGRYHDELGQPVERDADRGSRSRCGRPADTTGGNRIVAAWLAAPVGIADPGRADAGDSGR